jgi:hypothetical protein
LWGIKPAQMSAQRLSPQTSATASPRLEKILRFVIEALFTVLDADNGRTFSQSCRFENQHLQLKRQHSQLLANLSYWSCLKVINWKYIGRTGK